MSKTLYINLISGHGDVILGMLVLVLVSMDRGDFYDTKLVYMTLIVVRYPNVKQSHLSIKYT